ncbi:MAG TPA: alpha/beta fold hydrolase [Rhodanobacteraceae bacterium]|nr:alpha/beta fold hydrolase [Rhodanobacteraceae bacterium]
MKLRRYAGCVLAAALILALAAASAAAGATPTPTSPPAAVAQAVAQPAAASTAAAADAPAAPGDACLAASAAALDAMTRSDFAAAVAHFNPQTRAHVDAAKLEQVWAQLAASVGSYQRHGAVQRRSLRGQPVAVATLQFANAKLDLVSACDAQDRITTFRLMPASMVELLASGKPAAPVTEHVEAGGVRVQAMAVASPAGPLRGALVLPAGSGPFPAVVLLAGSGPNDYDETIGPNTPLRDLAAGLARHGITSLRYDKRTRDYPQHWAGADGATVDAEVTDDALTAVRALAGVAQVDPHRIFVLGHSLGAMMAPRIGQRDPGLAGLVLMAAPARSLLDVLVQQSREQGARQGLPDAAVKRNVKAIEDEQRLLADAAPGTVPEGDFMGSPQSYWAGLHRYDQAAVAKALSMPMLFLQGGADFQVSPTLDFARWKQVLKGKSNVSFHLYPGLSHLFMPAGTSGTIADYQQRGHVAPQVIADIAAWITAQKPASRGKRR